MDFQESMISCGVVEMFDLRYPPNMSTAKRLADSLKGLTYEGSIPAFVTFSDVVGKKRLSPGEKLAEFLIEAAMFCDVGEITESPAAVNPNTGHKILVWTWTLPDLPEINEYLKKAKKDIWDYRESRALIEKWASALAERLLRADKAHRADRSAGR